MAAVVVLFFSLEAMATDINDSPEPGVQFLICSPNVLDVLFSVFCLMEHDFFLIFWYILSIFFGGSRGGGRGGSGGVANCKPFMRICTLVHCVDASQKEETLEFS